MTRMHELGTRHEGQWNDLLARAAQYDFYHLPQYHGLAERRGEGEALLFVCENGSRFIALPLLLRSLSGLEGLDAQHQRYHDATSVYGYAGPFLSHVQPTVEIIEEFKRGLSHSMQDRGVVSVFSRFHPLLPQRHLLAGLGETQTIGQTISIDLTLPIDVQRAQFRKNHKEGINRLRRSGVQCIEDTSQRYLAEFVSIYQETMRRVGAAALYFFDEHYFESLMKMEPSVFHLFVAMQNGEMIAGGLFAECCGTVQYHLGGTRTDALKIAPMKLIFDTVRLWASERNNCVLHLGGGVGSGQDSLFAFKAGFSDRRHDFSTWRWIAMPETYEHICAQRDRWNDDHQLRPRSNGFFPSYRSTTVSQDHPSHE